MTSIDNAYLELIAKVRGTGTPLITRNSHCLRLFGEQIKFHSCPLISIRKTAWKNALREWEWFMSGSNDIKDLHESVHPWWKPWAVDGKVNYNYSQQFREFHGRDGYVDQIDLLIWGIKQHPNSRRNVITTWNTAEMVDSRCAITNCHGTVIQSFVEPKDDSLHLVTYQRSADLICGVPHNWIQYWAFMLWLSDVCDKKPGTLTWIGGDVHIYKSHFALADKMLLSQKMEEIKTPDLFMKRSSKKFQADDFLLSNPYLPILTDKAEMVV